jgi:hypothetical protein
MGMLIDISLQSHTLKMRSLCGQAHPKSHPSSDRKSMTFVPDIFPLSLRRSEGIPLSTELQKGPLDLVLRKAFENPLSQVR